MPYLRLQWVLSIRNFNPVSASFIEPVYKNMPRLICVIFSYDTQQCRLCYTQSTQLSIRYPRILRQLQQATFLNPIQHPERLQQPQCATTSPRPSSRPSGRRYGPIIKCNSPHSTRTSSLSFLRPLLRLYLPWLIGLRSTFRFFSPYSLSWCCSTWCGSFSFAQPWCSAVGGRRMLAETVARSERGL
jgi:hypothetical protein